MEITAAQNKAMALHNSRDPRALHEYLNQWRTGRMVATTDYILSVVHYFTVLHEHSIRPDLSVGSLLMKFDIQRALWNGRDVDLTKTEFRVIQMFVEQEGIFMTYRAIYDVVHYAGFSAGMGVEGYKTNVRSLIKRLRRKFEMVETNWNWIENYNGFGYRWRKQEAPVAVPVPLIITPINGVVIPVSDPAVIAK